MNRTVCSIYGGADFKDYSYIMTENRFIIAADGGLKHCEKLGILDKVNLIVGDFDSYKGNLPENIETLKFPSEKDDTDLMIAVKEGIKRGYKRFEFYGCAGGRIGHIKANTQILSYLCKEKCHGAIFGDEYDEYVFDCGDHYLQKEKNMKYVSIFSETEKSEISLGKLKYSGDFTITDTFPLGVSNEFTDANYCIISVKSGRISVFMEKTQKKK